MEKPRLLRKNYLYIFGLLVLVTGLPLSLFLISISQFILAGSFFLEGDFKAKFRRFLQNKAAVLVTGIWLMHVLGLLWTTNLEQGWNDVRIKLPLLILTIVMAGSERISTKQFFAVMATFIAAVFIGTMVSTGVLTGIIHHEVVDIRDVFIFGISHIRFGLFTCIAIFSLVYFAFSKQLIVTPALKIFSILLAVWFLIFLFLVESLTGFTISILGLSMIFIYSIWKKQSRVVKSILVAACILAPVLFFTVVETVYEKNYAPRHEVIDVNARTAQGNPYKFNFDNMEMENGYFVYTYMCDEEMKRTWNSRSAIPIDSVDKKNQPLKYTLIRFLASKGLRKDSVGVMALSDQEITSIEKGIPNVHYQTPSLLVRLMQVMWEFDQYNKGGDPNGHSIMQRLESWKAASHAIADNLLIGVGTGDLPRQVFKQYQIMNSKLDSAHYLRPHNQFLAITVAFGIIGLCYFLFAILFPLSFPSNRNYFYVVFILTALISMLTEDTLETQPGATFFAFFNALFLFTIPAFRKEGLGSDN